MNKLDHQSHTSRLDQHISWLRYLERQVRMLTTAIHDNNFWGHSTRVATENNDANCLDKLEGLFAQSIKSVIRTNKKLNSLTSKFAANEDNNDDDTTLTKSIDQQ